MDVKNSPAGHVTEKCAIRQMSFSTDDGNEYYELVHLFTPTEQAKPAGIFRGRDEAEDCRNETIDEGQSRYRRLSTPILPGETYNEVFGTNDPVKMPEPKSSEARDF